MTDFLLYLAQVSIGFSILYLLYKVALQRLTFHKANRILLLLLIPLSFALPLWDMIPTPFVLVDHLALPALEEFILIPAPPALAQVSPVSVATSPFLSLLFGLYCLGFSIALFRLLFGIKKLIRLKKNAQVIQQGDFQLFLAEVPTIFSCFHWIFIPRDKAKHYTSPILRHEQAHAQFGHTYDLIVTELYLAICWFNPLVYFFRKSIRAIHEYQADEAVLSTSIKKSAYLSLLLNHLGGEKPNQFYSYFNHPIIKKRIEMMTKSSSSQISRLRYLLLLPMLLLLLMAFTTNTEIPSIAQVSNQQEKDTSSTEGTTPPSLYPIANQAEIVITAPFGQKRKHHHKKGAIHHGGIDLRAAIGEPIIATASGKVITASSKGDWGKLIVISHDDGFETRYAHLHGFEVVKGQEVTAGQVIGYTGNSGRSTGPHLHYEIRQHGKRLNPRDFFKF